MNLATIQVYFKGPLSALLLLPVLLFSESGSAQAPAMALQIRDSSGVRPEVSISVVEVGADQELALVRALHEAPGGDPAERTIVVSQDGDPVTQEIRRLEQTNSPRRQMAPVVLSAETVRTADQAGRLVAPDEDVKRFTMQGMNRAGWWIAISVTGLYSIVFYFSSDLGPFVAASSLVLALQFINAKWPNFYPKYVLGNGAKLGSQWAERLKGKGVSLPGRAGDELGRIFYALGYSFLVNSGFKLALSWFDVAATFGSLASIANTASSAFFGFISTDIWNVFVSRNLVGIDGGLSSSDPQAERFLMANRLLMFSRQIVSASAGPFLYFEATHGAAIDVLMAVGTLGLMANVYGKPFIKTADWVLSKMERSTTVRRTLDGLLRSKEKLTRLPTRAANRVSDICSAYLH